MGRSIALSAFLSLVIVLGIPFAGGAGPGIASSATAESARTTPRLAAAAAPLAEEPAPRTAIATTQRIDEAAMIEAQQARLKALTVDTEHLAQKPVPKPLPPVSESGAASGTNDRRAALEAVGGSCPGPIGGGTNGAPGRASAQGVPGTTSDDLASFAYQYNAIRVANCLDPIPYGNFYWDSCMEDRLFWMAESPSPDPLDGWGHSGTVRSDGVPAVGCDGNLAGGSGNSGATVAIKWWESSGHRNSLYRPGSGIGGACIAFAMTHGGIDEPYSFTRAAARWTGC